ncbi:EF-hand calcium-binding domain-containing protein 13 [Trichechus inunguis]
METKVQLFCQAEENIDIVDAGSHSFATDLPSRNIYSKKYIKFSKTTEKKISPLISPDIRGLSPEHKKTYETSVFLHEEKYSDKIRKKKSLQLHSKRTEIISSSVKLSKEKITKKESSLCKLPNQYRVHRTSSPIRKSSITGKKETLSKLYQTLYDEVPCGHLYSQELNALQKACKLFSKIQNGKIYVNDLPVILCTLKISVNDSEMRQALKTIGIDGNGLLDFSTFLKALNDVSYWVSQDPAFQDALKIFCRIKDGQVATDELAPVLSSMNIFVDPETVQETINYTFVDSNNMVDMGNIIFILNELQEQYEDVSIMEEPDLDETTSVRKLSKLSRRSLQFKKIGSLPSRLSEISVTQKLNRKSLQHHSKIMENNDNLEFKSPKNTWQIKKILEEDDDSDVGSQESYPKDGINLKKHSDKAEIHDLKYKPQRLKSISNFKKSLDKSDISSISELKKPAVRRHSSLLKEISSKEKTAIDTLDLESVCKAIRKLKENYVAAEELQSILPSVGITLSDKEFQKIVTDTTRNENEMVKLDDFMRALAKERSLSKCAGLSDVIKAIDKIKEENVDCEDLNTCLQNFGVYLSKSEFEKIKDMTHVDEMRKVNFKEFVDNMMNNTERFSEKLLLPDAIENLNNLSKEKMNVSDLWNILSSLNSNLKKDEFLAAMKLAPVDEGHKVQFEELAEVARNVHDASRLDELKKVTFALNLLEGDMIAGKNLEDFLRNIGIKSPKEEVEKILQSDFISEDNMVNIKDCMRALRDTKKFSNFMALNEAINTLDRMKESYQSDNDKHSDALENTAVPYFTDETLQGILDDSYVEEIKETAYVLSHVDNGRISISNLEHALKNLNVNLTEEDFSEALKRCDINENMEVDLKEFLMEVKEIPCFKKSIATQLLLATSQILQNDLIDVSDLKTSLMNNELYGANAILDEVLRHKPEHENGKMTIQEFMSKVSNTLTIPNDADLFQEIATVDKIRNEKMPVNEMSSRLLSTGVPLSSKTFQEILRQASIDENSEVSLKQLLETLNTRKPVPVFENIHSALNTVNLMNCDRIQVNDLKDAFDDLGVPLKREEYEMLEKTLDIDEKGDISLKTALLALKSNKRFQDFREVNELAKALDKVTNEKVHVDDIKSILKGLGIYFPEEELQEVLTSTTIDNKGNVVLKDFVTGLTKTPYFTKSSEIEGPLKALASIRRNVTNPDDLGSIMKSIGVPVCQDVIQRTLKNVTFREDGTVNLEEFMDNLSSSRFSSLREKFNSEAIWTWNFLYGDRVDVSNLDTFLGNMRMEMPVKQLSEFPKDLSLEVAKKVNKKKGIKDRRVSIGGKIDVSNVNSVLESMAIKLTEDEQQDLLEHISATADEDLDMNTLKEIVKNLKEKIEVCNLDNFLDNMGIELTYEEQKEMVNHLPANADGKINQLKLMNTMKTLKRGKVSAKNLNTVLENLGVELTEQEFQNLQKHLSVDVNENVDLNTLLDEVKVLKDERKISQRKLIETAEAVKADGRVEVNKLMNVAKAITGKKIDSRDVQNILGNMAIKLTDKESLQLLKTLSVDGLKVDVHDLDTVLGNMASKLTTEELNDLIPDLSVDADGKVDVSVLMDRVKAVTGGDVDVNDMEKVLGNMRIELTDKEHWVLMNSLPVDGEKVDVNDIKSILENMGIELTPKGRLELMNNLPVDSNGKVSQKRLMDGVKSLKGGVVDVSKLDTVLQNMEVNLTEKEISDIKQNLPVDVNGKVDMKMLMEGLKAFTGKKVDASDLEKVLGNMGIQLTEQELKKLQKTLPVDDAGKVFQKNLLDTVKSLQVGKVNANNLDAVLGHMGIKLKGKEYERLKENLPINDNGKVDVNNLMDALTTVTGKAIDVSDLENVLENMGIEFTDKEREKLMKNMPIDADGKIYNNRLMDGLKSLKGGIIDATKVETLLQNMGMNLAENEISDLTHNLPVDVHGKIEMKKLMDGMKAFTGKKIHSSDLENVLGNMGIELTDKELIKLQETLPVDAAGNVFQKRVLDGVKSIKGGKVNANNLDTVLGNLGIKLTQKEHESLTENLPLSANGMVELNKLMDAVTAVTGEEVNISDMENILGKIGIELTDKECLELEKNLPVDADGKVYNNRLMDGVKALKGGIVDVNKLDTVLENMGMKLTGTERKDLIKKLPVDVNGKVEMKKLIDGMKAFTGKKIDANNLLKVLGNMGIELTEKDHVKLLETLPIDDTGKVYQNRLLNGVKSIKGGMVKGNNLDCVLENLGVELTEKERESLTKNLPLNANENVDLHMLMEAVETITGGEVDVSDVENVLGKMGITFTDKELVKLVKNLPVNSNGKVYKSRLLGDLKPLNGGTVDVNNLDLILRNQGLKLTEEEINDLKGNLPIDADGKVTMRKLLDGLKAFTGEKVDVQYLPDILSNIGIELTDKEQVKLLQMLPVDAAREIYKNRLLDGVKSFKRGKVKRSKINTVLENMGIQLTEKECNSLAENLLVNANGTVELNKLMDEVTAITGGEVNVSDIENILEKIGINLTDKEWLELEKNLPVDADGKVYQNRLMDGVKALKGGIVDVNKLDTVLENMGMKLAGTERKDLIKKLPVDVNGKVDMKKLMDTMKAFTGKKVDASNLLKVLGNMGIELTEKDHVKLLETLPIDDAGKVYQNRLLNGVKSIKGGMVKVKNLDTVLENLGVELTEKERESLTENLPLSASGKVGLNVLMEAVETITGGEVNASDVADVLDKMGITFTDKECVEMVKNLPTNANGKVYKNRLLGDLKPLKGGIVDVNKLDLILRNQELKLTEEEINDLKRNLPIDENGNVAMKTLLDGLKAFTGEKIDVRYTQDILRNMGIELTDKEQVKLLQTLPVDAAGKTYKNRLLDGVKSFKGGKVRRSKMNTVLENMGIQLTEKELNSLAENLPVNASGKVDLNKLMDGVKAITGDKANIREIKNILESIGVELTEKEHSELMKNLPVDVDENFYQNRLMDGVKSLKGGKVDIIKLDTVLRNMGMKISEMELKDMAKNLPVDVDGKVDMRKMVDGMKAFTGEKIDVDDLQNTLESMGIELTEEESLNLKKTLPVDDTGMVFQNRLLDGVKSLKGGNVNVNSIDTILENMGIKLTEPELQSLTESLPVKANRKIGLDELMNGLKTLMGGQIYDSDVKNVLGNIGIELTEKECLKLLQNLPIDDGKIYQNRLMDGVKSLKRGTVDINKLNTVLGNMGMSLTEKELKDLTQNLTVDVDGKVTLKKVMDGMKNFSGVKVDGSDLQQVLGNMGIELTKVECSELEKTLPVDAAGQVFQNRVLDGVKSLKGAMVNVSDLNKVLGNFGIKLTEKELEGLTDNLPADVNGKIVLSKLMDKVKAVIGEDIDIADIQNVLENMGIELTDKECLELVKKLPVVADRKIYQNRLLEGMKTFRGGKIDVDKLDTVLENMGMNLTEKELKDLIQSLPVNVDGKVGMKKVMDEVKAFTGEKIDVNNLDAVLRSMGIELADMEYTKLLKTLPVSGDGKVHKNRLLKGVKSLKRGKVDISHLYPLLEKMDMKLTEKELIQLREILPVDANGKVDLNKVIDGMKEITGGKVDINDMKTVLENMGIELTDNEYLKLVGNLPFDDDDKIYQNRLLEGVKSLKSGKVNVNNLENILDNMGIKLAYKELKDLAQNLPVGVDEKISLETLMNKVKVYTGEKVDSKNLKNVLGNLGIELTDKEQEKLLKTLPTDAAGKVFHQRLLKGVKFFKGGMIHANNLDNTLEKLGIKLTEEELTKLSENLQVDANGKVDLKKVMDGIKATTGGEVDGRDVKSVLRSMGIELTDKESLELVKNLPFNDDNQVFKNRLLEGVKSLKGGKVNVNNLDTTLDNLGIKLSDEELKDLMQSICVGVDKKISLETLMEKVKDFTGEKIDSSDLKHVLGNLGIELTDKELEKLLKTLPVDAAGKAYHNRVLKGIKSLKEGKINKNNLRTSLEKMKVKLTEEQFAELSENLQADANGMVDLYNVMEGVKAITGKVDVKNLKTILGNMGINLTNKEFEDLIQNLPVSVDNKVALKTLNDEVKAFAGEKIDSNDFQKVLKNVGIELTDKECKQLLKALPIDADGKVFQNRLLKDVKSNKRGKVNVNNLDTTLDFMGVKLTEKELDLVKNLLSNADEKVDLKKLMDKVEVVTGREVDINDIETVLRNMGIELTDKDLSELKNNLPVDDGKVYQKRLLDGIKFLKGGKIDTSKMDTVLGNMGMNLTETELKDLTQSLPVDGEHFRYQ